MFRDHCLGSKAWDCQVSEVFTTCMGFTFIYLLASMVLVYPRDHAGTFIKLMGPLLEEPLLGYWYC